MQDKWWTTGLRVIHPNMREIDLDGIDVPAFVRECRETGANVIVPNGGGVMAYYPTRIALQPMSTHLRGRDILGEMVEAAHREGLKAVPRIDFGQALEPAYRAHPDWFAVDRSGKAITRDGVYRPCPNGPYRNEGYAKSVIDEIISLYEVDGFHLNAGTFPGYCYCESCVRKFRVELGADIPRQVDWDSPLWKDFIAWRYRCITGNIAYLKTVMRDARPGIFWMQELSPPAQLGAQRGACDLQQLAEASSVVLVAVGDAESRRTFPYECGLATRYVWNLDTDGDPVMNIKFSISMEWDRGKVPENEYLHWNYESIGNGAGLKLPMSGTFQQEDSRDVEALKATLRLLERQQRYLAGARPVTPIALAFSQATFDFYGREDPEARYGENVLGMYEALVSSHLPFTVIPDSRLTEEGLRPFGVLVLANTACISDAQAEAIRGFVERGGGLFATFEAGLCDERGGPRKGGALDGLLGVESTETASFQQPRAYMYKSGHHPLYDGCGETVIFNLSATQRAVRAARGAEVPMRLTCHKVSHPRELIDRPEPTAWPLAVARRVGRGRTMYFAHELDKLYFNICLGEERQLLANAVRWCLAEPLPYETDAPSTVEVNLARKGSDLIVHLINGTGKHPLDDVVPVHNIRVRVLASGQFQGAEGVVSAGPLELKNAGAGSLELVLPRLDHYEAVVLEGGRLERRASRRALFLLTSEGDGPIIATTHLSKLKRPSVLKGGSHEKGNPVVIGRPAARVCDGVGGRERGDRKRGRRRHSCSDQPPRDLGGL